MDRRTCPCFVFATRDDSVVPIQNSLSFVTALAKNGVSFAGGGGTGLTVSPIGFLVIKPSGDVSMLNVKSPDVVYNNSTVAAVGNIIEKSPEVLKKLKEVFKKDEKPVEACFTEDTEE